MRFTLLLPERRPGRDARTPSPTRWGPGTRTSADRVRVESSRDEADGRSEAGAAGKWTFDRFQAGRAHEGPVQSRRIARRVRHGERGGPRPEPQADPPERQAGCRPRARLDPDGHRPGG